MQWTHIILTVAIWCAVAPVEAQEVGQDWYRGESGERVDFDHARRAHREVLFGAPLHVPRALLEQSITLAMGSAWYWTSKGVNAGDWDLQPTLANFGRRFHDPSVFRFDTNNLGAGVETLPYDVPGTTGDNPYYMFLKSDGSVWVSDGGDWTSTRERFFAVYSGSPVSVQYVSVGTGSHAMRGFVV